MTILDRLKIEYRATNSDLEKEILEIVILGDATDDTAVAAWMQGIIIQHCIKGTLFLELDEFEDTTHFYQKHCFEIEKYIREYNSKYGGTIQDYWKRKGEYAEDSDEKYYYKVAVWFVVEKLIGYYYHKLEEK